MSTPCLSVLLGNNLPWTLWVTRRWKSTNLVYAISQPGAFLILSKANIQYGLTLSKALERSASKTQTDLSPSRILCMHKTAFCGSLKYDITACEGCMRCAVWRIIYAATLPSTNRSMVFGIPSGRKWSALGPALAFGIHTPTCIGGRAVPTDDIIEVAD